MPEGIHYDDYESEEHVRHCEDGMGCLQTLQWVLCEKHAKGRETSKLESENDFEWG